MFDGSLMLQLKLPLDYTVHSISNKFVTSVKINAVGDSKLNDSPMCDFCSVFLFTDCSGSRTYSSKITSRRSSKGKGYNYEIRIMEIQSI